MTPATAFSTGCSLILGRPRYTTRPDPVKPRRLIFAAASIIILTEGGPGEIVRRAVLGRARFDDRPGLGPDEVRRRRRPDLRLRPAASSRDRPGPAGGPPARRPAYGAEGRSPAGRRVGADRQPHPSPPVLSRGEAAVRTARDVRSFPQRHLPRPGRRLGRGPRRRRPRLRLPRRRLPSLPRYHGSVRQGHGEGRAGRDKGRVRGPAAADRRPAPRLEQDGHHPARPRARRRLLALRLLLRRDRAPLRDLLVLPLQGPGLEGSGPRGPAARPTQKGRTPMSWTLKIRDKFSAAHYLKEYRGKCEKVHGHTFRVEVAVRARELDRTGIGFDFAEIKSALAALLPDHALLNEVYAFNPTAENLARHF